MITLTGRIRSLPRVEKGLLGFCMETESGHCRIVRMDPQWQKRDVLFLSPGQEVTVTGDLQTDCLIAQRILITNCCRRQG